MDISISPSRTFHHRFLSPTFSPSPTTDNTHEFNEADLFFSDSPSPNSSGPVHSLPTLERRSSLGLLDALNTTRSSLSIPKPRTHQTHQAQQPKFQNSAPVKIPVVYRRRVKEERESDEDDGEDYDDDDEMLMLPPHEIVDMKIKKTTSSVLEGVGRTLKGTDLRRVRNAVWRQTGFMD